ncbi:ABC transporter substrate-binding protein [Stappia stellulata]|uniref:ABC transporter substrate-binding protein n=1 Tax=Stappia stellulata TaxID=71235 RepID=UPI001FE070B2|nr:ABC transporter substrate-binding protein [Stappia stellulata]
MLRKFRFLIVLFCLAAPPASAAGGPSLSLEPLTRSPAPRILTIYSSLDSQMALPLLAAFQKARPSVGIKFHEMQTQDIHARIIAETDRDDTTADLVFSSAMDLQVKLANDGYAQPVRLPAAKAIPSWAQWRHSVYGVTFEPAVILYHKPSFEAQDPPRTRAALARYLKDHEAQVYGRVGTYDVERAGLGLFFLARDGEHNRGIWDLFSALGAAGVKLYSNSSAIVERVADGRFVLGYNILGSYATAWARTAPDLGIVLPEDYTVVMSRIGLVPRAANAPDLGAAFLDFLLSRAGQTILAQDVGLPVLLPDLDGPNTATEMRALYGARLRPIPVGPALVVYLDQVKRQRLIDRWNRALRMQ